MTTNVFLKKEKPKGIHRDTLLYYLVIGAFFALIIAKDLLSLPIPSLLYTAIWLFVIVYFDIQRAAAFTTCSAICFASSLSVTIPIAAFVVMALLRGVRKIYIGCIFCAVALIFSEMTHFYDRAQNFRLFVNTAMFIVLVVIMATLYLANEYDPVLVLKHYVGFFVFLATDILVFTIRDFGSVAAVLSDSFRIGQTDILEEEATSVAMSINTNGLAFLALMAVAITLVLLNQKHLSKKIAIPVIVYCSFIGALTISKTFVICYAVLIVVFYFWYLIEHSKNIFAGIGIAMVILALFYLFTLTEVYQNILFRFENSDLTTGRTDLMADYLDYMNTHPDKMWFGIGLQRTNIKAGFDTVPHNAFLETYVCLGVVGLVAATILVANLFRQFRRKHILLYQKRPKFLNYIPFFIYLFFIQTFQFIKIGYIFVPLALVCLCVLVPYRTEKKATVKYSYDKQKGLIQ